MRLCKDCKHYGLSYIPDDSMGEYARCTRTSFERVSAITGKRWKTDTLYCSLERSHPIVLDFLVGGCGKRGRYWEAK